MDSDCFDDDVLDGDLMLALDQTQAISSSTSTNASKNSHARPCQTLSRNNSTRLTERPSPSHNRQKGQQEQSRWGDVIDLVDVDFPSDLFDTTPERGGGSGLAPQPPQQASRRPPPTSTQVLRQSTLWGGTVADDPASRASQPRPSNRAYRADLPVERPSHHALNTEAMQTWVYPMNLGPIRDYQFSIVKNALFNNTLVALPTGLGKTFIAASVILNFFRWTRDAKIIFVAPTKPLAAQQVEACLNIAGIPRSVTTLLTGETKPVLREDQWESKRLFFMTPQTLQNDLSKGYANPKSIVLLVIDEAHRATGDYAYVKVIEHIRRFSTSFRVLALTATPGSTVEGVQEVIDNLGVSHVEIRTEDSIDIRKYVHSRQIDRVVLEPSDEILRLKELFSKTLKPLTDKISQLNIYYGRDPMSITAYGLMKARQDWMNGAGRRFNQGTKMMVNSIFTILQSLAHSIKLLDFHGIRPFFDNLASFRSEAEAKGEKGSKYKRQILSDSSFQEMMETTEKWLKKDNFVGHPKMTHLCDTLLNHFMDAGAGSSTRVIVFSEYRDSAEEIVRVLNIHRPLISASLFVGQADSKKSEGMKQKQQIETIEKFRDGTFNVLVATSIGEEGLDIGQVDLIVCYDASSSPIRMLQRMGRTGRKRAGKISLLLMKGKEEDNFIKAQDNYEKMQKLICEGSRFNFRHDMSSRIVPREVKPEVDKKIVDIPIENTQDTSLPEPKARTARTKKPAKKKFHMPDGVETGFVTVSSMFGKATASKGTPRTRTPEPFETDELATIPDAEGLLLSNRQLSELDNLYRHVPIGQADLQEIEPPNLSAHYKLQRSLRPTANLKHGSYTKRWVQFFKSQSSLSSDPTPRGRDDSSRYLDIPIPAFADDSDGGGGGRDGSTTKRKRSLPPTFRGDRRQPTPKRQKTASKPPARRKSKQQKSRVTRNFIVGSQAIESGADGLDEEKSAEDDEEDDTFSWISYAEEEGRLVERIPGSSGTEDLFNSSQPSAPRRRRPPSSSPPAGRGARPDSPPSSPMPSLSSLDSPPPALRKRRPFVPRSQRTEGDDDLPSIDELISKAKPVRVARPSFSSKNQGNTSAEEEEDDDDVVKRAPKRRARRALVEDSESD